MPAVARKTATESHYDFDTVAPRRAAAPARGKSRRWHEAPPASTSVRGKSQAKEADLDSLLDHFGGADSVRIELEQKEVEARRAARKRDRLKHRPFHLTMFGSVLITAPVILLASLLWMRSSALDLSRQDAQLQDKIEATRFELENTRKQIAAVKSSPQVEHWAAERGWRQATQQDFDDVSRVLPVAAIDGANANGSSGQ